LKFNIARIGILTFFPPKSFLFLFFILLTPQRHFLGRNRVQRCITRLDRTFGLSCRLVKENRKKGQKSVKWGIDPSGQGRRIEIKFLPCV
jgi:hypothetical protein